MQSTVLRLFVLAAALAGSLVTIWGLSLHGSSMLTPIWTPQHVSQAKGILGIAGLFFVAGLVVRRPALTVGLMLLSAAGIFGVGALLAASLVALTAFLLGWAALRAFDPDRDPDPLTAVSAGLSLLILVLPALGIADLDMRPISLAVLAGSLSVLLAPAARGALWTLCRQCLDTPAPAAARWIFLWLITAWFLFAIAHAAMPDRLWDVFAMHMMIPNQIVTFGRWSHAPSEMAFAVMPLGANYLFAFAMQLGGEPAVKLVNLGFTIGLLALTRDILRTFCGPTLQDIGLLMLLGTPLVLGLTVAPMVENTLAFLVLAATRALLRWSGPDSRSSVLVLLLLLPALASVKLHGVFVASVIFLVALWHLREMRESPMGWFALIAIAATTGAIGLSQYFHAWYLTGNPVFPFLNQVFQSQLWPPIALEDERWMGRLTPDLLYEMTFRSSDYFEGYPGLLGFSSLALLLAGILASLLFPRRTPLLCLTVAAPPVLLVLTQIQYIRYFHFALPLLLILKVYGLAQIRKLPLASLPAALLGFVIGAGGLLFLPAANWTLVDADLRGAYDPVVRHRVAMQLPERLANEMVNAMAPGRPRVIYGSTPYGANLRGWPIYTQWYNWPVFMALYRTEDPSELDATLARLRGDFVIARFPTADAQEAKLVAFAERRGRVVAEVGPVRIWRLAP